MNMKSRMFRIVKRYLCFMILLTIFLITHHILMAQNLKHVINTQTLNMTGHISSQVKNLYSLFNTRQKCELPETSEHIIKIILYDTINNGKPFENIISTDFNAENDQYLLEIARSGINTVKELQEEFFLSLLPSISTSENINIGNNFLAKWITIVRKDKNTEQQINSLSHQVSLQNFEAAIKIIDVLPITIQLHLQKWRKNLMDYIYVHEFLKTYQDQA